MATYNVHVAYVIDFFFGNPRQFSCKKIAFVPGENDDETEKRIMGQILNLYSYESCAERIKIETVRIISLVLKFTLYSESEINFFLYRFFFYFSNNSPR